MTNATQMSVSELVKLDSLRWPIELFFQEQKSMLCSAFRQECEGRELQDLADRLKTSGGIEKLKRQLTAALPNAYRTTG